MQAKVQALENSEPMPIVPASRQNGKILMDIKRGYLYA